MTFNLGASIIGGKKVIKQKPKGWMCVECDPFIVHPYYLTRCPECGSKRP